MKLTCLSKGAGYHFPPCHVLDACGFRLLLDCPLDLSALVIFSPVPVAHLSPPPASPKRKRDASSRGGCASLVSAEDLIRAVPRYKTVKGLQLWEPSLIDVVLVSSPAGMLGLPFLTRNPRFSAKIYVTEAAARIGKMMMEELVVMHEEYVQFYGPGDEGSCPNWMKSEEIDKLPPVLKEIVAGKEGEELGAWLPLYSAADISECMHKVHTVKYAEESCYNGTLILKPFSSGLEIGAANWTICGPRRNITYLSSSIAEPSHSTNFDHRSLQGNDMLIYSDFSSFEGTVSSCIESDLSKNETRSENDHCLDSPTSSADITESIAGISSSSEEQEKMNFICSCIVDSVREGGSVMVALGQFGITLQLLELLSESLQSSDVKVPIYLISPAAEEALTFANAVPEWLSKERQEKLYSGEPLFNNMELVKQKRLHVHPAIHSFSLLMEWQEPCIVFSPHWSLRLGSAIHLLRRWHADPKCLLILEKEVDAHLALSTFQPVELQVLQCSFPSGIMLSKISLLLKMLQPKIVLLPEDLSPLNLSTESSICPTLYYTENMMVRVPRLKEDYEACLSTELAFQLQPKRTKRDNTAIARLQGKVILSSGKFLLLPLRKVMKLQHKKLHWGAVDPSHLQQALQRMGINASVCEDQLATDTEYSIRVDESDSVAIQVSASTTLISATDSALANKVYEAFSGVSDGI